MSAAHVLSCPLCGLRYGSRPQFELHVREDHAPPAVPEGQERVVVAPRAKHREKPASHLGW